MPQSRNNPPFTNHLCGEQSPYLLAHAHNPVDWYPWGDKAFAKAKQDNKPVLLSVGYSTCHWCHVMAHESFENEEIAKLINEHFIAIKVDREERPDIDHIYMTATSAMTGQGGWPLTVFLTPQAEPFYGGTYFPPYAKWGSVGFIDLLGSIAEGWKRDRENILNSGRSITEDLRRHNEKDGKHLFVSQGDDHALLDRAFDQLNGQFDAANGGFGSQPKFPMAHNLSFLLRYHKSHAAPQALEMVTKTLTAMAQGGIWDHLGGGFHRYSTDQHWLLPHFEKMLYDQALLSRAYLEAFQATKLPMFGKTAFETLEYVLGCMTDKQGGFYSAEDADSTSENGLLKEGAFYVFSEAEIIDALGKEDAKVFNYCYGIQAQGNASFDPHGEFIGKNILYRAHSLEEAAGEFHRQTDEIQGILKRGQQRLLELRALRPRPFCDDKVLCDWNGLMIASFAFASRVLSQPAYLHAASKAADFILSHMMEGKSLLHRWRQGEAGPANNGAGIPAMLEDYAFFIYGLLETYEAGFDKKYLDAACSLADRMIDLFGDKTGGFYMTASGHQELILRPKELYDGAIPSGNSVAVLSLLKLYALSGQEKYNAQAQLAINCFTAWVNQAPSAHCFFLCALDWHLQGTTEVTFQGASSDATLDQMLKVLYKDFIPSKSVKFEASGTNGQALICYRGRCQAPINSVESLEKELIKGNI